MKTVTLIVGNLDQAIQFYHHKLSFQLLEKTNQKACFLFEQQQVELLLGQAVPQRVTFHTEHIDTLEKHVLKEKIRFIRPPYTREEETETFNRVFDEWIIEDPEGNALTFSSFVHFRC